MIGPNCSSKSAQCGQWKSSYKVMVTGASAEPRGMGCPSVRVTGLADTAAEGAADGARLVRHAWNAMPPATTTTRKTAIIMNKMRRSRFRAAACSAANRARSRAFLDVLTALPCLRLSAHEPIQCQPAARVPHQPRGKQQQPDIANNLDAVRGLPGCDITSATETATIDAQTPCRGGREGSHEDDQQHCTGSSGDSGRNAGYQQYPERYLGKWQSPADNRRDGRG